MKAKIEDEFLYFYPDCEYDYYYLGRLKEIYGYDMARDGEQIWTRVYIPSFIKEVVVHQKKATKK